MTWVSLITLLLRALPEILFLWRRRVERGYKEAIHEDVQLFREAVCSPSSPNNGGNLDRAAELLERRVREARQLRQRRSHVGEA